MRLIVVGGGIAGLSAAYLAKTAGHDVVCLDGGERPGGLIRSERIDGFLCEAGPQAILDDAPDTIALLRALDLESRIAPALAAAKKRFIFLRGALRPVPASPVGVLRSGLLSPRAKLRLLGEPLVRRPRAADAQEMSSDTLPPEESLLAFASRRLGREAAERLFATAVIGIYAADAALLGARAAFPRLVALEQEHGSLLRGLMASRRAGRKPGHPVSFPNGLEELPQALARALGTDVIRARATDVERRPSGGWTVATSTSQSFDGDAVVIATELATAAALLRSLLPAVADHLSAIQTVPIALACLGFRDVTPERLGMDLAAYGFLVARGETPKLLGCQYESSTFAGRAPEGGVLLRTILGGFGRGFDPAIVEAPEAVIADRAVADLRTITGLRREPDFVRVYRYPRALPLVDAMHTARVRAIDGLLAAPRLLAAPAASATSSAAAPPAGLHLLGQGLRGVGVNEGIRAAAALVHSL